MVKITRTPKFLNNIRSIYKESLWYKIKSSWEKFQVFNPSLAYFGPVMAVVCTGLGGTVLYLKLNMNPVPKYYEYIVIFRPDDPQVQYIRKDDSLGIQTHNYMNTLQKPT